MAEPTEIKLDEIVDALAQWQAGMPPNLDVIDRAMECLQRYQDLQSLNKALRNIDRERSLEVMRLKNAINTSLRIMGKGLNARETRVKLALSAALDKSVRIDKGDNDVP